MENVIIDPLNQELMGRARARIDNLTKPRGSLGKLEEIAMKLVGITGTFMPQPFIKKAIFTFAGDHGIADSGVSLYPKEVTTQMVYNFLAGGAGINVLARHAGAEVIVVDIGVDNDFEESEGLVIRKIVRGTRDMRTGAAMTADDATKCLNVGIDLAYRYADAGYSIFGTGDMGIGNTTPSSAIAAVITGKPVAEVTGRGTGVTDEALHYKTGVIEEAIRANRPDPRYGLDVLAKVGGAEIGGIAGLILGGAARHIPVVIDGFISTAGALIAYTINPGVRDYIFAAHLSVERGHRALLDMMGLDPILNLDLRLGEGTGAALGMNIIEAALKVYREMATFDEAGVSKELTE